MSKITLTYLSLILYFSCMIFPSYIYGSEYNVNAEVPLFYWDARPRLGFSNFGDAMSVSIVEKILGRSITTITAATPGQKKFLAIGSIVNYAEEGDALWGTGVNGKYQKKIGLSFQYA